MSFCRIALLMAIVCLEAAPNAFGALSPRILTANLPPAPDGERFLFIVETSSAMEDLQASNEATIYELIRSGLNGYMRSGDTFGLWTYNKEVQTGQFPMRVWDGPRANQQATIAAAHLNQQKYENSASLKDVMASLTKVIRAVSNLNVFVVSDGGQRSFGTPFDRNIAAEYKKLARDRRQAQRPFVTTLVVRGGWFVEAKVNVSGSSIQLPERPSPVVASVSATNSPATTNRSHGPVLALRAADAPTNNPTAAATPAADPAPGPSKIEQAAVENTSRNVQASTPNTPSANATLPANSTAAAPSVASPTATVPTQPPPAPGRPKVIQIITKPNTAPDPAAPGTVAETNAVATLAQNATVSLAPPAPTTPAVALVPAPSPAPPASPAPSPAPSPASPTPPSTALALPPVKSNALASTDPVAADPPSSRSTVIAIGSGVAPPPPPPVASPPPSATAPLFVAARELNSAPVTQTAPANGAIAEMAPGNGLGSSNEKPHTLEAVAAPAPRTGFGFNWMLVYGVLLLGTTLFLFRLMLRRARTAQGSIITQSMERR
ncbi:MAG TPA: hypothetical protein VNU68_32720 [Verrucomicrobiae bacterium]|nr:hypothetical protein [Verrucomicrobiae bacterium]